jgi:hypothetical protein
MSNSYEIPSLEKMIDAVVQTYEQATEEERLSLSPFFKIFRDMAKADSIDDKAVEGGANEK